MYLLAKQLNSVQRYIEASVYCERVIELNPRDLNLKICTIFEH
jgi:hypothetical protein